MSDDSIKYEPVLPLGTRMTVVGGPVVADGYTWYEVEPVGFSLKQDVTRGWVAMADHDETPWIALASSVPALLTVNWVRNLRPGPPLSEELIVCVTIENISENNVRVLYSDSQFSAFDGDGFVYPSVVDPYFLSLPLSTGELRPGERRRGELPYVVGVQAQPLVRLRWHTGIEGTVEIAVDLPAAGIYDPFGPGC